MSDIRPRIAEVEVYMSGTTSRDGGFSVVEFDTIVPGQWDYLYNPATGVFDTPFSSRCEICFSYAIQCIYPDDQNRIWAVLPSINGFFHEVQGYEQRLDPGLLEGAQDPTRFYSSGWRPVNSELSMLVNQGDDISFLYYHSDFTNPRNMQGTKFWSRARVRWTEQ